MQKDPGQGRNHRKDRSWGGKQPRMNANKHEWTRQNHGGGKQPTDESEQHKRRTPRCLHRWTWILQEGTEQTDSQKDGGRKIGTRVQPQSRGGKQTSDSQQRRWGLRAGCKDIPTLRAGSLRRLTSAATILWGSHIEAAVYVEYLAGDVAGLRGAEEEDGGDDVVHFAKTAGGDLGDGVFDGFRGKNFLGFGFY